MSILFPLRNSEACSISGIVVHGNQTNQKLMLSENTLIDEINKLVTSYPFLGGKLFWACVFILVQAFFNPKRFSDLGFFNDIRNTNTCI